jgi:hypothetical protein
MTSLEDWHAAASLFRPVAVANLVAAAVVLLLALMRPAPLVLCIMVFVTFSGPWSYAVLRKATLELRGST